MKSTSILKQSYDCSNNFDAESMWIALRAQVDNHIFRELIQKEKHSITLEFRVLVNEEEKEDKDPRIVQMVDCINLFKELLKGDGTDENDPVHIALKAGDISLFSAWKKAVETFTDKY